ncbi:hypothetical protein [Sphingomonas sp. KR3-1]|uniref:hypothetical protein n=1 Tax=Sphingomonas sp. KR3-1 TaxID=3156611 RepID=UPI0032B3F1A5
MPRRSRLIPLACTLAVADVLFLGWRWRQDSLPNADVTYVGLDSSEMIVDADAAALSLQAGHWRLGDRPLADVGEYAKGVAAEGHMPLVTAPSYGQFLRSVRDLKARKICHILIREGGTIIKAAPTPEVPVWDELSIPALLLCGESDSDMGFHGTLPPDGPIHLPATSLR